MRARSTPLYLLILVATLLGATNRLRADGPIVISEFLASNHTGLADEDGVRRDWIELHNPGPAANLNGWFLTDDPDELTKWEFPSTPLAADGRVVVFASDMNRIVSGAPLHTNFKLSANPGSYVALVQPDGVTIASAFADYPAQYKDVSYGSSGGAPGYLVSPTPNAANAALRPLPPILSPGSKFFAGIFTLTMTKPTGTGTLRYTTNGTVPTLVNGFTYSSPVNFSTTTTINAAIFINNQASPVVTQRYVRLTTDVQNFNSDLPLVVVHSLGSVIDEDPQVMCAAEVIDTTAGRAHITDTPAFVGLAGIKLRGSSSLSFPKKQYAFETWDHNGDDENVEFLGLPAEADWVLYGPYTDKTLMRDVLAYQWSNAIGRYAPRTRYVEMFLRAGTGSLTAGDYIGTYAIIEKIKRDGDRVDIAELRPDDNTEPAVTGGYIVKKDRLDPGDTGFWTSSGQNLCYVEPKEDEISPAQSNYLVGYFNAFEAALYGPNFADPLVGYAKYIDVDSWIDHHLMVELTKNIDGYRLSSFLHKDRGGKLVMGPIWDYNLALGNADYLEGWIPQGWYYTQLGGGDYPWWPRLFQDPAFRVRYTDRWYEVRESTLTTAQLLADIDAHASVLAESQVRNFQRWPILGIYIWPNPPGYELRNTFQKEVDWMKQWLSSRLAWMDTQFVAPPAFNQNGGPVPQGFQLTVTPPPGITGTIFYTLDGSDPFISGTDSVTLIPENAAKRVTVPTTPINNWTATNYFDLAWTSGAGGVGYEQATGYEGLIGINVGPAMYNINGTCYIRVPFTVSPANVGQLDGLTLRVRYDDGFIAYLNGQEIARTGNAPAGATWNSEATYAHDDSEAVNFQDFDVTAFLGLLQAGNNLLAIHGLNSPAASSDFLISVELVAARIGTPTAQAYTGPITLNESAHVTARVLSGDTWGAKNEAIFTIGPVTLFVNEFMAENASVLEDPDEPGEHPDWLEIYNPMSTTAFLGGMYLTDNLTNPTKWQIPNGVTIPPGGFLVFYCDEDPEQGPTHADFKLSKSGESIGLFGTDTTSHAPIDTLTFGLQSEDVSFGRHPDGALTWRFFTHPSPGSTNFRLGDVNVDGAVNAADFAALAGCLAGPNAVLAPSCTYADLDGDLDADLADVAALQKLVGGG